MGRRKAICLAGVCGGGGGGGAAARERVVEGRGRQQTGKLCFLQGGRSLFAASEVIMGQVDKVGLALALRLVVLCQAN